MSIVPTLQTAATGSPFTRVTQANNTPQTEGTEFPATSKVASDVSPKTMMTPESLVEAPKEIHIESLRRLISGFDDVVSAMTKDIEMRQKTTDSEIEFANNLKTDGDFEGANEHFSFAKELSASTESARNRLYEFMKQADYIDSARERLAILTGKE